MSCVVQGANKWWNRTSKLPKEVKWETLEHNGVMFPPAYIPHGVKMRYDGEPLSFLCDFLAGVHLGVLVGVCRRAGGSDGGAGGDRDHVRRVHGLGARAQRHLQHQLLQRVQAVPRRRTLCLVSPLLIEPNSPSSAPCAEPPHQDVRQVRLLADPQAPDRGPCLVDLERLSLH